MTHEPVHCGRQHCRTTAGFRDAYRRNKALFASLEDGNKLIVPEFGLLECTNVLWKHVRFHGLRQTDAEQQIQILVALDVVVAPVIGLMPRTLEIGLKHQLAIYDSVYITLAEQLGYPLITDDS